MSISGVAHTDFLRLRRTKVARLVVFLLVSVIGLSFYAVGHAGRPPARAFLLQEFLGVFLLPVVGLGLGYLAIAGERESGNVQYLLSLPNSRLQVLLGKYLSRGVTAGSATLIAYAIGGVIVLLVFHSPDLGAYVSFTLFTVLFVLAYTCISVSISAVTGSRARALAGSAVVYFVGNLLWFLGPDTLRPPLLVARVVESFGVDLSQSALDFLWFLGPSGAYTHAVTSVVPSNRLDVVTSDAWFLSRPVAVLVLVGWIVLPMAVAYWRFCRADLS